MSDPFLAGLELVKMHHGTSGQAALAKCILSLYNDQHAFSIGEILGPLDNRYSAVIFAMLGEYEKHGETEELRQAGQYVYENFPRLIELSEAMNDARAKVRARWQREHEEEMRRQYPNG